LLSTDDVIIFRKRGEIGKSKQQHNTGSTVSPSNSNSTTLPSTKLTMTHENFGSIFVANKSRKGKRHQDESLNRSEDEVTNSEPELSPETALDRDPRGADT
jgi:hypothetical protein